MEPTLDQAASAVQPWHHPLPLFLSLCLLLTPGLAGCISDSPSPSPEALVPFRPGDQATYQLHGGTITWTVEGLDTAMLSNRSTLPVMVLSFASSDQEGPPIEVLIARDTHRIVSIKNPCASLREDGSCAPYADISWYAEGNPWLFGHATTLSAARTWPHVANVTVPGPYGTTREAAYTLDVQDQGWIIHPAGPVPQVKGTLFTGGLDVETSFDGASPFPAHVVLRDSASGQPLTLDRVAHKQGAGDPLPLPQKIDAPPIWTPLIQELETAPLGDRGPPVAPDFPPQLPLRSAIQAAQEDEDAARFFSNHPQAVAVSGSFSQNADANLLRDGPEETRSQAWSWELVFADLETQDAWRVVVRSSQGPVGMEQGPQVTQSEATQAPPGLPSSRTTLERPHVPFHVGIEYLREIPIPREEHGIHFDAIAPGGWYETPRYWYMLSYDPRDSGGSNESQPGFSLGRLYTLSMDSTTGHLEQGYLPPSVIEDW